MKQIKSLIKKYLRKQAELLQCIGIDLLPHHFYSEIPTFKELQSTSAWKKPLSMNGINGSDINQQFNFLQSCCSKELIERLKKNDIYSYAYNQNKSAGFGEVEADFLYCFIYTLKPKKVIQIGAGFSTAVIKLANIESSYSTLITCIDPYPNRYLLQLESNNEIVLYKEKAQEIPIDKLIDLSSGDLLFIDSTHTVKPGSEVNKLIFEVLPRLKEGVYIHFHDIYFPYDYQRGVLSNELFFHNESNLLYAYLMHNQKYKICTSLSMLHYTVPEKLKLVLINYKPQLNDYGLKKGNVKNLHFPSSIYLKVIN